MKHCYEVTFNVRVGREMMGDIRGPFGKRNVVARNAIDAANRVLAIEFREEYGPAKAKPREVQIVECKLVATDVS